MSPDNDPLATSLAFRRNVVVAASAGTGKTFTLVGVLVHLLVGGTELGRARPGLTAPVDPSRVVAMTFSRKAASEIRARLVLALEQLGAGDPVATYRATLDAAWARAGLSPPATAELARRAGDALEGLPRAFIGTLHGYAASLVAAYPLELGLPPGVEVGSEEETDRLADVAITRVLSARAVRDAEPVRELLRVAGTVEQAVEHLRRVLVRLEEDGGDPDKLAIACDEDAPELEHVLRRMVEHAGALADDARCGAVARVLLGAWEHASDPAPERQAALVAAVRAFCELPKRGKLSEAAQLFFDYRDEIVSFGATNAERGERLALAWQRRHDLAPHARAMREVLAACDREVRHERLRAGQVGFGDVLRAARDLLRDRPPLAREIGASLDALLIDEVQDTSRLQLDLVRLLWEEHPSGRRPGEVPPVTAMRPHGLFVVGDRKQSIYGFRGADVTVFAELAVGLAGWRAREALGIPPRLPIAEPASPRCDLVSLQVNRRSDAVLLRFDNAFARARFASGPGSGGELFEVSYVPATEDLVAPGASTAPAADEPRVRWLRPPIEGNKQTPGRLAEGFVIAERIDHLLRTGAPLVAGRALRPRDVAVLALTNGMLDVTAYTLGARGIPYVVAGRGFYAAREVSDLVALLTVLVRPTDRRAWLTLLRGAWAGLSDTSLLALTWPDRGLQAPPPAEWREGPRASLADREDEPALDRLLDVTARLRRNLDRLPPATLLEQAVRELELEETLAQLPRAAQRIANVRKLIELAEGERSPAALLTRLEAATARERPEAEAATFSEEDDAVRLLTVHASKGLDFPVVFLPEVDGGAERSERPPLLVAPGSHGSLALTVRLGTAEGKMLDPPSYERAREAMRRRDRAERARLAYVASTRAAHAMFFVGDRRAPKVESASYRASTAAALETVAARADAAELLVVEPVAVPPRVDAARAAGAEGDDVAPQAAPAASALGWRIVSIATTSLQDFHHCPRRFQLVHLLDLPERERPAWSPVLPAPELASDGHLGVTAAAGGGGGAAADARTEGTWVHRVLERIEPAAFGAADARARVAAHLTRTSDAPPAAGDPRLVSRIAGFLTGEYAQRIARESALIERELPFVVEVKDDRSGRAVALRGSIDLLVRWPDSTVDVIDYKRARGPSPEPYAFQLDAYALAVATREAAPRTIRTGILFLGGSSSTPVFRPAADRHVLEGRLLALAARLVEARHAERFPRVELATCKAIRCGYVGLCHPARPLHQLSLFGG